jgi:hypothetical protein
VQAVKSACRDLKQVCAHLDGAFAAAVEDFKAGRGAMDAEPGPR